MKITPNETYIKKPSSFAREENDEYSYESRIAPNTTAEYNNPNITLKGVSHCYDLECDSNNLEYDFKRDQLCCKTCGLVLKEAFDDNKELIRRTTNNESNNESLGTTDFSQHRNKNYLVELIEIQEYKNKLNLDNYPIL